MPKALFFDVDGTISVWRDNAPAYIPESTINAIRKTRQKGNLCFLATGRSMPEITKELIDIGFDGYVCGAGNCLIYKDEVILSTKLPKENVEEIVSVLTKYDTYFSIEGDKGVYINDKTMERIKKENDYGFLNICSSIYKEIHYDDVNKICFDSDLKSFEEIKKALADKYSFFNSSYVEDNKGSGEISLKNVSKGSSIKYLLNYLNIPKQDSYAFGDADNDIEMLKICGTSIAMGRHSKGLEPYADFITKKADEDGIEYAMKHFNLI